MHTAGLSLGKWSVIAFSATFVLLSSFAIAYTQDIASRRQMYETSVGYYDSPYSILVLTGPLLFLLTQFWLHVYRTRGLLAVAALCEFAAWVWFPPDPLRGGQTFLTLNSVAWGLAAGVGVRTAAPSDRADRADRLLYSFAVLLATVILFIVLLYVPVWKTPISELRIVIAVLGVLSLLACGRPLFELAVEGPTRVMYRMRETGPGLAAFPASGPVMVLANPSAYLAPLFLAADVPRPLTPMMTSKFYDKWFIYPLVRYLLGVIRVPELAVKHQAPEIGLAVAALDQGRCLV